MTSDLGNKLVLLRGLVLVLLQLCWGVWGQDCVVEGTCLYYQLPRYTIVSLTNSTQDFTLDCTVYNSLKRVSSVKWLFTSNLSLPQPLDVHANPRFRAERSSLELKNATPDEEGAYFCQAEYADGTFSRPQGVGCVFIAGRAFYKTCPVIATREGNCEGTRDLQAEVGDSVDFNARIEFRQEGSCRAKQRVRLMYLRKIQGDGFVNTFICSNLGRFGDNPNCSNRSRVSVFNQGTSKYDIELRLHNLTAADSGQYYVQVDLDGFVGGRRSSIYKNFTLTIQDKPSTIPAGTDTPTATATPVGCSGGSAPLLLLNGEVLSAESHLVFANISEGAQALLCVTSNENCCDSSKDGDPIAQFLAPNNTSVTEIPGSGLFVSKGKQAIRLNRRGSIEKEGRYCCSIHHTDGGEQMNCVNINN